MLPVLLTRALARRVPSSSTSIFRAPQLRASIFNQSALLYPTKASAATKASKIPVLPVKKSPAKKSPVKYAVTKSKAVVSKKKVLKVKPKPKKNVVAAPSKKVVLYTKPPKRPHTGYLIFTMEGLERGTKSREECISTISTRAVVWNNMPSEEKKVYQDRGLVNRTRYLKDHNDWLASLSPEALRQYRADSRVKARRQRPKDDNGQMIKRPPAAYVLFMGERMPTMVKEEPGVRLEDRSRKLSAEWKHLGHAEKSVYLARSADAKVPYYQAIEAAAAKKRANLIKRKEEKAEKAAAADS